QGLRVIPVSAESVEPRQPNSGVVVLPSNTAPASRSLAVTGASFSQGPAGSIVREPLRVGQPRASMRSLTVAGTPSSGPIGWWRRQRSVEAAACASAPCASTRQNALITGFRDSIRRRIEAVTSLGDRLPVE